MPEDRAAAPARRVLVLAALALLWSVAMSAALWNIPAGRGDRLDLESLLPGVGHESGATTLSAPPSTSGDSGAVALVLAAIVVVAALPLITRGGRRPTAISACLLAAFVAVTALRCGLLFAPAAMFSVAAVSARGRVSAAP